MVTRGPPEINDFRLNEIEINDNIARTSASTDKCLQKSNQNDLGTLSVTFLLKQDTRNWNATALLSCLPRASTPEMLSRTLRELTSIGSLMKTTQSIRIMKHE